MRDPQANDAVRSPEEVRDGAPQLVLVGASHRTTPLDILEAIALDPDDIPRLVPELRRQAALDEALLLSTCNRTEIYGTSRRPRQSLLALEGWLLGLGRRGPGIGAEHLFNYEGAEAAQHLFRVASGVDSLILGETQVAGQIQDALDRARESGNAGGHLTRLFSAAARTCKRARTETAIGAGVVSVASASVHLARRIFGNLHRRTVLVVGAGETGRLAAQHFREHEPRELIIANRNPSRAENLAREVGARAAPLDRRYEHLEAADIVVCATRSPEHLFTVRQVKPLMKRRSSRMALFVDISLPRNVEPDVAEVDNVFLHDMQDLRAIVDQNLARRAKEVPAVERIVSEEVDAFTRRQSKVSVGPVIQDLRQSFENVRRAELERFLDRFRVEDRELAERLTRDLVNKLLHWPMVGIQEMGRDKEEGDDRLEWVRRLFNLNGRSSRRRR
ncbi:MAG: glutamyl-tRNA reductase [Candidatus Eisenbacteria bacterium]|nr:glutamyl-tRNA reductase [Candidatus Eisenbacteria bacterium]